VIDRCEFPDRRWRRAELPLLPGTGICLVGACGWACGPCEDGLAAWAHTQDTGHPTIYRPDPDAIAGCRDAAPTGVL